MPAAPGMNASEVGTPALIVDLDALDRNLFLMADAASRLGVDLRPHAKTHKCVEIAHLQLHLGAAGIACQKASEAEVFVDGGVGDVLISNEIVGRDKLARVAELAQRATIAVCVDTVSNVTDLQAAAEEAGSSIGVLVELNTADYRAGVATGEPAARLAAEVVKADNLRFAGLQAYNGPAQHMRSYQDRLSSVAEVGRAVERSLGLLGREGIRCDTVTGAGTGTYDLDPIGGLFTEVQPGTYVFMDADYAENRNASGEPFTDFEQSLHVISSVMSRRPGVAILDAGSKAIAMDNGLPVPADESAGVFDRFGDEHGTLRAPDDRAARLGDQVRLIPYNCDPTVNLYDWLVGTRGKVVESVWPVAARGATL